MSFKHGDHRHDRVAEARECERRRELVAEELPWAEHGPATPCGCGTYDRCYFQRMRDAPTRNAAIRAMHRAYND